MIYSRLVLLLLAIYSTSLSAQQERQFRFTWQTAHPNAKPLMKDNFFWSEIEEEAPFGSDAGSDAAYGYYNWRKDHRSGSPITYLKELLASWQYPQFAWDELDTTKIKVFISTSSHPDPATVEQTVRAIKQNQENTSLPTGKKKLTDEEIRQLILDGGKNMGLTYLVNQDEAIIGVAFAQIVLEGKLDPAIKNYAQIAVKREMLPVINRHFGTQGQQNAHNEKMTRLLKVLQKIRPNSTNLLLDKAPGAFHRSLQPLRTGSSAHCIRRLTTTCTADLPGGFLDYLSGMKTV